jgi:hypothetical protein
MSINALRARLSALRKNIPQSPNESVVESYNSIVRGFEKELENSEIADFLIPDTEVKPSVVSFVPGGRVNYSKTKYCDKGVFTRQVEGVWAYLEHEGAIDPVEPKPKKIGSGDRSQVINFHGDIIGSTIQQGDNNTAILNFQADVQKVLEEIRPTLNAAKLSPEAKQELRADFETVEAQIQSPNPKHGIIRESFVSARHVLEHAFGAGMVHFYPALLTFLEHHK